MTTDGMFAPFQPQPSHVCLVGIVLSLDRIHDDWYNMVFSIEQEFIFVCDSHYTVCDPLWL